MVNAVPPFVFPSNIPADSYPPDEDLMEEEPVFGAEIPSVWDSLPTDFDIEFWVDHNYTYTEGEEETTVAYNPPILEVSFVNDTPPLASIDPTYINTDIINISPTVSGAFPGEKWYFIFDDLTIKELPRVNNEDWMTITKWQPSPINEVKIFYHFAITYGEMEVTFPDEFVPTIIPGDTIVLILSQYVYWSWQISLAQFQNDVEKSKERMLAKGPTRKV